MKHQMKRNILTIILILSVVVLVGCEGVDLSQVSDEDLERISEKAIVCDEPYMRHAYGCCLDKDNNNICDEDEINKPENIIEKKEVIKVDIKEKIKYEVVKIDAYVDYEDPFSKRWFLNTLPMIEKNYIEKGLVEIEFHNFPLLFHFSVRQ